MACETTERFSYCLKKKKKKRGSQNYDMLTNVKNISVEVKSLHMLSVTVLSSLFWPIA